MEPKGILPDRQPLTLEHIAGRIKAYRPQERRDHLAQDFADAALRPAAILIALMLHEEGLSILFTKRTAHLPHHANQVSFPGGKTEAGDPDAIFTALREAQEEIGLDPENAHILGTLDRYITISGFIITPVVAVVMPQAWQANPSEVAHIFEVPLEFILSPGAIDLRQAAGPDGIARNFYALPWQEEIIWGATAGMLKNLVEMLLQEEIQPEQKVETATPRVSPGRAGQP
jgi:8-oxo-dGTP pyrophosphatase MutT (NUDIX family)